MENLKKKVAERALTYLDDHRIIGVGTGTTVNCFIEVLASRKHWFEGCVASSHETEKRLRQYGLPILPLTSVDRLGIYFDGADEVNHWHQMIKGGGGALTREKVVAFAADTFVCMVERHKWVDVLGRFPVAVEVLPMARSVVARAIVALGGDPVYRQGVVTDNGNIILDVHHLPADHFETLEADINNIPGVVDNGLFIRRTADVVLIADPSGVEEHVMPQRRYL